MQHLIEFKDGKWQPIQVDWSWGHSNSWADQVAARKRCAELNSKL